MNFMFYLGHPAHFHLFKNVVTELKKKNHKIQILIKRKDVLENLVKKSNFEYINILPEERKNNKFEIIRNLIKRNFAIYKKCIIEPPDLLIGTSVEICQIGKLLHIPSINVNEDDYNAIIFHSMLGYPFTNYILAPNSCPTGKKGSSWEKKTIHYHGFHELAYLHPKYFIPSLDLIKNYIDLFQPYYIIRFSALTAHHDKGKKGINSEIADTILKMLLKKGKVYITSEKKLNQFLNRYRITIPPDRIHHALFYANIYIGDSQTMAAEAAVLGTPSIRFNDFVGKLGYLEELEHKYNLSYGIKTSEPQKLYQKIEELLHTPKIKQEWQNRSSKMLTDKIDVTAFMVWFIENFPASAKIMKENPNYQNKFK